MAYSILANMMKIAHAVTTGLAGDSIVITDLAGVSIEIDATIGRQEQIVMATDVVQVQYDNVDFIVQTRDLRFNGIQAEAKRGWTIKRGTPQGLATYEVLQPTGQEDVFRYLDPDRTLVRIHAKLTKTEI